MLEFLLERLQPHSELFPLIIATSVDSSDDPLAAYCRKQGMCCYRGSLDNVASRFKEICEAEKLDAFVRISADSPFMSGKLVRRLLQIFQDGGYDVVTNCFPRTFPKGESVEIFSSEVFEKGSQRFSAPDDYEHVTPYFYRNAEHFRIQNVVSERKDFSSLKLSVDTEEDFYFFTQILDEMKRPLADYSWQEIADLAIRLKKKESPIPAERAR